MAKVIPTSNLSEIMIQNKAQSIEKKEKAKQKITELLSSSTSHGIPNIVKAKNLHTKITWSIFFIISTGAGLYYVVDSVLDYLKFQTITNIKVTREKQSQFPTVSFCGDPSFSNLTLDQIILSTRFEGVYEKNLSKIFEEFNDTVYGKCFRYNSDKNIFGENVDIINTTVYGKPNNLRIGFNLNTPDELREILIQIHNHTSPPHDLEQGGYWLKTGSVNYFEVERVFYEKLPEPYNNCFKDVESFKLNMTIINNMKHLKKSYSQNECYQLCSHLFALQDSNCNCKTTLENFEYNCLTSPYDALFNSSVKICVANYLKTFRLKERFEKCQQFCPEECDSMNYVIYKYYENFLNNGTLSSRLRKSIDLESFETYEDIQKHYIRLYIYYKDLKHTLISENPKIELFNLISSIGGILGLFLGISFLSFIEMFEIIFEIIYYLLTK